MWKWDGRGEGWEIEGVRRRGGEERKREGRRGTGTGKLGLAVAALVPACLLCLKIEFENGV